MGRRIRCILCDLSGAEETEGGGVAVQEGGTADGSDLTVAEKAAHRYVAEVLSEDAGVEVGTSVEALSAPEAREEECPGGTLGSLRRLFIAL